MFLQVIFIIVIICLSITSAFEIRNNLRNILSIHAFASSALSQLQEELILHQYDSFVSNDLKDCSLNWIGEHSSLFVTGMVLWFGYKTYHSPESKLFKLQDFLEYTQLKKNFRTILMIFVFIFLRDVQNAI
jgi:hypothetical protein